MFCKKGLKELRVRIEIDNTTRFVPLLILHSRQGNYMCKVLPALHELSVCYISSKIGTNKAALKSNPEFHLPEFGTSDEISPVHI